MEPRTNNFGARLRSLIDRKGLTLVEFAEQFPLSESNLHNWLKRSGPPLEKHWPKLAEFFGVSEDYVAYGTPNSLEPTVAAATLESDDAAGDTEELRELSWRLKNAMEEGTSLSLTDLAVKMGVPQSRVIEWLRGMKRPRAAELRRLAELLGVSAEWLTTGEGPRKASHVAEPAAHYDADVFVREVPVISWTHAGTAATYEEMPRHFQGTVATSSRGRRVYGLRVEGDSMIPRYNPGDIVILDALGEPRNGKGVVVKFSNDAVQIRLYHKLSNGKIRLTSTRPEIYPTDDYDPADFHWIHPVLQTVRDEL